MFSTQIKSLTNWGCLLKHFLIENFQKWTYTCKFFYVFIVYSGFVFHEIEENDRKKNLLKLIVVTKIFFDDSWFQVIFDWKRFKQFA